MTSNKMELAVNHAVNSLRDARLRAAMVNPAGLDTKRSGAWCEFGFPETVSNEDLFYLYRRRGLAFGAVNKLIQACWRTSPWVIQGDAEDNSKDETPWERGNKKIFTPRFWAAVAEADKRRLVCRFSGLLISFRDNKSWKDPVTGSPIIDKLIPAWAGSLTPVEFDQQPNSPSYGEPTMWRYRQTSVGNTAGVNVDIHPDRIFILGDWREGAIGFLEPAFNNFVSIEKTEGGSGESFLKNAARQLSVSFDKDVNLGNIASMYGVSLDELNAKFNDAARDLNSGTDLMLINQGASVTPLVSNVPDPTPTYNINLQSAAAALDIPTKILVGMQTGERASTEDQKYFNARCQSRRGELSFEISDLISHLIRLGAIKPVAEFTVMWDDLTESTQSERLANSRTMAEINTASLDLGELVFTRDEIREVAGFDPLGDVVPLGEDELEVDDGAGADPTE